MHAQAKRSQQTLEGHTSFSQLVRAHHRWAKQLHGRSQIDEQTLERYQTALADFEGTAGSIINACWSARKPRLWPSPSASPRALQPAASSAVSCVAHPSRHCASTASRTGPPRTRRRSPTCCTAATSSRSKPVKGSRVPPGESRCTGSWPSRRMCSASWSERTPLVSIRRSCGRSWSASTRRRRAGRGVHQRLGRAYGPYLRPPGDAHGRRPAPRPRLPGGVADLALRCLRRAGRGHSHRLRLRGGRCCGRGRQRPVTDGEQEGQLRNRPRDAAPGALCARRVSADRGRDLRGRDVLHRLDLAAPRSTRRPGTSRSMSPSRSSPDSASAGRGSFSMERRA